ncbi:hypothetical protein Tco_1429798 [Tanacetum coccineum]
MAEETRNPTWDIPLGLIGSMSLISVVYCLMVLALPMMVKYTKIYRGMSTCMVITSNVSRNDVASKEEGSKAMGLFLLRPWLVAMSIADSMLVLLHYYLGDATYDFVHLGLQDLEKAEGVYRWSDPITLISRLDMSDPLHLYPNDSTALTVVSIKLKGTENYQNFLDDSYMQIRSSILSREVLPNVISSYATISSEESHGVASGSIYGSSQRNQASTFGSNVPNRGNFQRGRSSNTHPRPNNLNNNRQSGGSGLVCENYRFNGHLIDRCFKIIGYPADFGNLDKILKRKMFQIIMLLGLVHLLGLLRNKWLSISLQRFQVE